MIKKPVNYLAKISEFIFNFNGCDFINYLDIGNVSNGIISSVKNLKIGVDPIPSRAQRRVNKDTIVYSSVRPRLKHYGIIKEPYPNMVASTGFITLDVQTDKADADYLYYNITQDIYTEYLARIADTNVSSYPSINPSDLGDMKIHIVEDIPTQNKIGSLLRTIDNKIENNNHISTELEALVNTVFDYWFVQFDFPDKNGKPYRSNGGKMVWNERLKSEIPDSWEVKTLSYFIGSAKNGEWGKTKPSEEATIRVNCIRGTDLPSLMSSNVINTPIRYIEESNKGNILSDGDLIIEISGGSPIQSTGRVIYINSKTLERFQNPIICSNFCKAIVGRHIETRYWFYQMWNRLYLNNVFFNYESKTTSIKNLLFDTFINHFMVAAPDNATMCNFEKLVSPIFNMIQSCRLESQKLSSLRDFLLPLLMNGQITINSSREMGIK